ncbi:hypothetical protein [Arthrobacter sp. EPSL27]|uniref:hypothetical protein n=1 Tax=Arthrobacter sp. EPSL27 TaxID=1745378 RepID=UPI00074AC476|nr:hypothetical protein [Arthrobacter sp. EPSL27]KUM33545.1 hypothetical protein AR539_16650 [Arthrobacter sp. EPSL27]
MTQPSVPGDAVAAVPSGAESGEQLAAELQEVIRAVDGVTALYPAQPLWQSIAGAVVSAVTGEQPALVALADSGAGLTVRARIGVDATRPAPEVVRAAAGAVRQYLSPRPCAVQIVVAQIVVAQISA